jgi:hypothetical protein
MALGGAPLEQQEEEEGLEQHEVAQTWHVTAYPDGTSAPGVMQMVWVAACTSEERNGTIPLPPIKTRNRNMAVILRMMFSFLMYARTFIS